MTESTDSTSFPDDEQDALPRLARLAPRVLGLTRLTTTMSATKVVPQVAPPNRGDWLARIHLFPERT